MSAKRLLVPETLMVPKPDRLQPVEYITGGEGNPAAIAIVLAVLFALMFLV